MTIMTRIEMMDRITAGEDKLKLSIEKWERVEEVYLDRLLDEDEFNGETCALCYDSADNCSNCPFFLTHGRPCDSKQEDGSFYWQDAARDVLRRENNGNVRRMVEALEKCREEKA